ncbi:hypothetical protein AB7281_11675 [Providencia rettgeri]
MTLLDPLASHPTHCPHCSSEQDIIAWGEGWMCRDCNFEWVTLIQNPPIRLKKAISQKRNIQSFMS